VIIEKIFYYSEKHNVNPYLACAMAWKESNMKQYAYNARNKNGSIDRGIFQLNSYSYPNMKRSEFYDVDKNIETGIKHIKSAMKKGKSEYAGLSIYNCGRVKVKSIYAERILTIKNLYQNLFLVVLNEINSKKCDYNYLLQFCHALEKSMAILKLYCRIEDVLI
jgi:hypothetical protein